MRPTEEQLIEFASRIVENRSLATRIVKELPDTSTRVVENMETFLYLMTRNACILYMQHLKYRTEQAFKTLHELIAIGYITKESIVQAI